MLYRLGCGSENVEEFLLIWVLTTLSGKREFGEDEWVSWLCSEAGTWISGLWEGIVGMYYSRLKSDLPSCWNDIIWVRKRAESLRLSKFESSKQNIWRSLATKCAAEVSNLASVPSPSESSLQVWRRYFGLSQMPWLRPTNPHLIYVASIRGSIRLIELAAASAMEVFGQITCNIVVNFDRKPLNKQSLEAARRNLATKASLEHSWSCPSY